jgi:hypothetical protein
LERHQPSGSQIVSTTEPSIKVFSPSTTAITDRHVNEEIKAREEVVNIWKSETHSFYNRAEPYR